MKVSYLTFDCYGTLIDWRAGIERELHSLLGDVHIGGRELLNAYAEAERKQESTYKKYREVLRSTVLSMSAMLGRKVGEGAARSFASSVPRWPAFPDTKEFLRDVGSRGYKRYILSNIDDDLLEGTIRNNHLEVDGFVTSEEVGSYKPKPNHWLEFLRRTGAAKEEVLHVAQSIFHDIIPTQRLGIPSVWVNRYTERLAPGASPSIITDSLENLTGILG